MSFEIDHERLMLGEEPGIRITVVGLGRFGCDAVGSMAGKKLAGVEYVAVHTDPAALKESKAPVRLCIGSGSASRGQSSEEERKLIATQLQGSNLIILVAGMGKGTGTSLAPVVALVARNMGILTIGIVTTPFALEGKAKAQSAAEGIASLKKYVDTLIVLDNEKVQAQSGEGTTVEQAFERTGELVCGAVRGISGVLTERGLINIGFADFSELLSNAGEAAIGMASASGEGSAQRAMAEAFRNLGLPKDSAALLDGVLVGITGSVAVKDLTRAMDYLQEQVGADTAIVNGYNENSQEPGVAGATIIATGVGKARKPETPPAAPPRQAGWPVSLPGITNMGIRPPAYLKRDLLPEGMQGLPAPASIPSRERIDKGRPETPAFQRILE